MIQVSQMSNEQFALWMANQVSHSKLTNTADFLYNWLESKKPKQVGSKYYFNGTEIPPPNFNENK